MKFWKKLINFFKKLNEKSTNTNIAVYCVSATMAGVSAWMRTEPDSGWGIVAVFAGVIFLVGVVDLVRRWNK